MKIKHLAPESLIKYNEFFTKHNKYFSIFFEFFMISVDILGQKKFECKLNFDNLSQQTSLKSEDELNTYKNKLLEFSYSIDSFYDLMNTIDSEKEVNELLSELYYTFKKIEDSDIKTFSTKLRKISLETIDYIFEKFDISRDKNFEKELINKLGDQYSMMILLLLTTMTKIKDEPESIDDSDLESIFIGLTTLLFDMNMRFKYEEHHTNYSIAPDQKVGRNASCPCGSGLKFKKCCLV